MGQSPSSEAGQANDVDGDDPWKRFTNRGQGETNVVVSQPLPNPRRQIRFTYKRPVASIKERAVGFVELQPLNA